MDTTDLARLGQIRLRQIQKRLMRRRVRRGVHWLYEHAPAGWQWNLFNLGNSGSLYYRAHDFQDNECVLALAFMNRADLASRTFGYVTYASVANALKLEIPFLISHGFHTQWNERESHQMLDAAWEEAVRGYAKPDIIPPRHRTPLEARYLSSLEVPLPRPRWWRRLAEGFVNFGKAAEYAWGRFYSSPTAWRAEHRNQH